MRFRFELLAICLFALNACRLIANADEATADPRPPINDDDAKRWLQNMVWYHHFSPQEISAATGWSTDKIDAQLDRWSIRPEDRPTRDNSEPLTVLPYPGGRHPRIGFLEGAIRPQRETKVSVFTPWNPDDYVVVDLPEAIWSNLGLTYLAHTHIATVWDERGEQLEKLEWTRLPESQLQFERTLPNGITFGSRVKAETSHVLMMMWLKNGSDQPLSDLRVQNCVMLKGAPEFAQQTNDNKQFLGPYVVCHNPEKTRWIITAWDPLHRAWANPPCPCLHSDPKFADCQPGETTWLRGWLSFYEGTDIEKEVARIEATGWRTAPQ